MLSGILEALQQEKIIPRSPSPEVIIGPLNLRSVNALNNDMSPEERLAKLQREMEVVEAEVKSRKKQGEQSAGTKEGFRWSPKQWKSVQNESKTRQNSSCRLY